MKSFSMKKLALLILLTAILAPSHAHALYKTLLKSGEELYATDYWIDKIDKQVIRLYINGSMVRMPRNQILYIGPVASGDKRVRTAIKRITFAKKDKLALAQPRSDSDTAFEPAASSEPRPLLPGKKQAAEEAWKRESERIDREREAAKRDFRNALAGGDFSMRQRARQRILDLTEARSKLLEKIKTANNGEIPDWWRWKTEG